jgi:hypothetical protein
MPLKAAEAKNLELVYSNLLKLYDLTLDRRKTLTGHASSLLSFTGIIQTVFLGLLITLATSAKANETLLLAGQYHVIIVALLAVGFVTFMITIGLAFLAFSEPKWVPAPEVLTGTSDKDWDKQLEEYMKNPLSVPVKIYELQLMNGITYNKNVNSYKYRVLHVAYLFLVVSLFLMAIVGFFIIAGIA